MASGGSFGGVGSFSHKAPMLSTDLRCYFECPQGFKKDYDLRLHLKIKHKHENEDELRRAFQDAEEEIALVKRSLSVFQCAMCPKKYDEAGPFYGHIKNVHNLQWLEYKEKFGRCESEVGSFECKICGRVVKYDRECVHSHLKKVHNINWTGYVDRIRKMRRGERPKELPSIETFECKICNSTVKFTFRNKHLKGVHRITESEYLELFGNELQNDKASKEMANAGVREEDVYGSENPPQQGFEETNNSINMDKRPYYENQMDVPYSNPLPKFPMGQLQQQLPYQDDEDQKFPVGQLQQQLPYQDDEDQVNLQHRRPQYFDNPIPNSLPNPDEQPQGLQKPPKSDIQDKTNTICSSCSIEFEFRKAFIEHCTTVHQMKFRTKSGATISAATM